jgi:hypothetical protein
VFNEKLKCQADCYHENAIGIYGDLINQSNGKRAFCPDCRRLLPALPPDERGIGNTNYAPKLARETGNNVKE